MPCSLQGRSIAKNLNKILLQIIEKRGLRVQNGSNLFFNINDDFYFLKLLSAEFFHWTNKNSQKMPKTTIFVVFGTL